MNEQDRFRLLACLTVVAAAAAGHMFVNMMLQNARRRGRGRGARRWWVRPVNTRRVEQGLYHNLLRETYLTDHEEFFGTLRMWPEQFDMLLRRVGPRLQKHSRRTPLPAKMRLQITLKYLAQGGTVKSLHDEFRVGKSTCHSVIGETCEAIWEELQPDYLPEPTTELWQQIASEFFNEWQMPNCVGAIDGRHMRIKAPPMTGSQFYCYKGFFSFVLMALADARYRFTWVDVGQYGSLGDASVWASCSLAAALETGEAGLPPDALLPGDTSGHLCPFYIVGDEAFPLKRFLMRPFPGRNTGPLPGQDKIFNYRLSRARRVVENAFGILVARWKVLDSAISCKVEKAENIVKAIVCLHNMLIGANRGYANNMFVDHEEPDGAIREGAWRTDATQQYFRRLGRVGANRAEAERIPYGVREHLASYFASPLGHDQAPWQLERVTRVANL